MDTNYNALPRCDGVNVTDDPARGILSLSFMTRLDSLAVWNVFGQVASRSTAAKKGVRRPPASLNC